MASNSACILCRIVKREIPSRVLFETEHWSIPLNSDKRAKSMTAMNPRLKTFFSMKAGTLVLDILTDDSGA
ncbi:hypothetical protein BGX21_005980, partial [Mortierella sp. AD011]